MTVKALKTNNMARKAKGPGYTPPSGKSPVFKMMGSSPMRVEPTEPTEPTEEELIAQADAQFGEGVNVKQYSDRETKLGQRYHSNRRTPQTPTWWTLSSDQQKRIIDKAKAGLAERDAYRKKSETHKIVKGEWVPR